MNAYRHKALVYYSSFAKYKLNKTKVLGVFLGVVLLIYLLLMPKIKINIYFDLDNNTEQTETENLPIAAVLASSKSKKLTDYEIAMFALKSCEGLHFEPYWDVTQWTIGWGTKSKKGEKINLDEANTRLYKEFDRVYKSVDKRFPHLQRWDKLVLTIMDFNVGHFGTQLNAAIMANDKPAIASTMLLYHNTSKGISLEGLKKRRALEASLLQASEIKKQKLGAALKQKVNKHINKANEKFTERN
tara:strand:+ start:29962 stop:30693 length:732 start_codon:yes stop_codon:yes gene_type:complete